MTKRRLHGLAALLLIAGGALYTFTDTLAPAIAGMGCTLAAALLMLFAKFREKSRAHSKKMRSDS